MLDFRLILTASTILLVLAGSAQANESKPVIGKEGVWQAGFGIHTYVLENEASDESSGLTSGLAGFYVGERTMLGLRMSYTKYELTTTGGFLERPKTKKKSVISITPLVRWIFRANDKLQPCLDFGIGITDQLGGEGDFKLAFTFGLGLHYKFKNSWGLFAESRGVGWNQEETNVRGSEGNVASNEFTLGYIQYF